jgi:glycosyltransferase involved in cell wall biosynthesis
MSVNKTVVMHTFSATPPPAVLAYPMHGQGKFTSEGYRTRDAHLVEWLGRLTGDRGGVAVVSRPEPAVLRAARALRRGGGSRAGGVAAGTRPVETTTWRLPDPRDRRRWWLRSADAYPRLPDDWRDVPAVVWNPFTALALPRSNPFVTGRTTVLDLLDDWSVHHAFAGVRDDVERAYAAAFASACHVTANGEGTVDLARRFGRDDVVLLPNGCDPERFDDTSAASGPLTVGYVGKIGRRLDLDGIVHCAEAEPDVRFVFAGPVLDRGYRRPLASIPNVTLLGDVHYDDVPALLRTFDVGWVPHRVGSAAGSQGGEVGGDIIKTYEYRAAGLPVLTTPVDGCDSRGLDGVTVLPLGEHAVRLGEWRRSGPRVARRPSAIPRDATWRPKAETILAAASPSPSPLVEAAR